MLDSSVDIGFVTRTTLNGLVESGDVSPREEKKFYTGAKAFFLRAFQYGEERIPVGDSVLRNAQFVHFDRGQRVYFIFDASIFCSKVCVIF